MKKLFGIFALWCLLGSVANAQQFGSSAALYGSMGRNSSNSVPLLGVGYQVGLAARDGSWGYGVRFSVGTLLFSLDGRLILDFNYRLPQGDILSFGPGVGRSWMIVIGSSNVVFAHIGWQSSQGLFAEIHMGGIWNERCANSGSGFVCDSYVSTADFYFEIFFGFAKTFWQETP